MSADARRSIKAQGTADNRDYETYQHSTELPRGSLCRLRTDETNDFPRTRRASFAGNFMDAVAKISSPSRMRIAKTLSRPADADHNVTVKTFLEINFNAGSELTKRIFEREDSLVLCLINDSVQAKQSPHDRNPAGEHCVTIRRSQID